MMPINSEKIPWWKKLIPTKAKPLKPIGKNIQNWRNLSPDEPPLPFAQNPAMVAHSSIKFSELDSSTSEIAPINKDIDFFPSASLYISHKIKPFQRELYTIPELSDMNTTISSSYDNSSVSPSSSTSLEQQQQINNNKSTTPATIDNNNILKVPTSSIVYNESDCKILFKDMIESAHFNLFKQDQPKEMHIVFDSNNNIGAVRFISRNGVKKDQIGFTGTSQYIPPEFVHCATYNQELSDVWALGISLYHMLTGHYPFDDKTSHLETFQKMSKSEFYIPDTLSSQATDLLRHMLNPSTTKRANFQFIQSHPWLNSTKKTRKKKTIKTIKKLIRIVLKGPYPPPSYYKKK